MSKNRYINTKFWDDSYVINLDPIEKLLFLYLITNPLTSICGIYEVALRRVAFDTGIDSEMVKKILDRYENDGKMKYENGWLAIRNFIKHQKQSDKKEDKINIGIKLALENSPLTLKEWLTSPLKPLTTPLNYSNTNLNTNPNSNTNKDKKEFEILSCKIPKERKGNDTQKKWCRALGALSCPDRDFKQCMEWFNHFQALMKITLIDKTFGTPQYYGAWANQLQQWMQKDPGGFHDFHRKWRNNLKGV